MVPKPSIPGKTVGEFFKLLRNIMILKSLVRVVELYEISGMTGAAPSCRYCASKEKSRRGFVKWVLFSRSLRFRRKAAAASQVQSGRVQFWLHHTAPPPPGVEDLSVKEGLFNCIFTDFWNWPSSLFVNKSKSSQAEVIFHLKASSLPFFTKRSVYRTQSLAPYHRPITSPSQ